MADLKYGENSKNLTDEQIELLEAIFGTEDDDIRAVKESEQFTKDDFSIHINTRAD